MLTGSSPHFGTTGNPWQKYSFPDRLIRRSIVSRFTGEQLYAIYYYKTPPRPLLSECLVLVCSRVCTSNTQLKLRIWLRATKNCKAHFAHTRAYNASSYIYNGIIRTKRSSLRGGVVLQAVNCPSVVYIHLGWRLPRIANS